MSENPPSEKSVDTPKPSQAKLARQARLDAALRANLRRRKAPEKVAKPDAALTSEAKGDAPKAE